LRKQGAGLDMWAGRRQGGRFLFAITLAPDRHNAVCVVLPFRDFAGCQQFESLTGVDSATHLGAERRGLDQCDSSRKS
jgi:hypothetical protein